MTAMSFWSSPFSSLMLRAPITRTSQSTPQLTLNDDSTCPHPRPPSPSHLPAHPTPHTHHTSHSTRCTRCAVGRGVCSACLATPAAAPTLPCSHPSRPPPPPLLLLSASRAAASSSSSRTARTHTSGRARLGWAEGAGGARGEGVIRGRRWGRRRRRECAE
eukprot:2470523-Rhodomonas_salina.1